MNEIFEKIESNQFAAKVSIESGLQRVLRNISEQPELDALIQSIGSNRTKVSDVLKRAIGLSQLSRDPRYENKFDIALTAYLWILVVFDTPLARIGAELILSAQGCWWSMKLALAILSNTQNSSKSGEVVLQLSNERPEKPNVTTGENFFISGLWADLVRKWPIVPVYDESAYTKQNEDIGQGPNQAFGWPSASTIAPSVSGTIVHNNSLWSKK
jgi:hypothetical protein